MIQLLLPLEPYCRNCGQPMRRSLTLLSFIHVYLTRCQSSLRAI